MFLREFVNSFCFTTLISVLETLFLGLPNQEQPFLSNLGKYTSVAGTSQRHANPF